MKSIWKYSSLLPPIDNHNRIFLGEGQTPLVRSRSIGPELDLPELYFKLENLNPTGSYKDRFAAVLVSLLQSRGATLCLATSSGNTGAALAAYCAAAGIRCVLAIIDGAPLAKMRQIQLYGASTFIIEGFGKDVAITKKVFDFLASTAASLNVPLPISAYCYCSEGMMGVQSMAYEIMEETENRIDHIFSPAGGGGLTLAIARGARAYGEQRQFSRLPQVHCVQPQGNDTIATPLRNKSSKAQAVAYCGTAISGLQVPNVLDGDEVIAACSKLNGNGYTVTDEQVYQFHRKLALQEGIFCEPAGAVALAGLAMAMKNKEVHQQDKVVCLVTGSGFKDMASVEMHFDLPKPEKLKDVNRLKEILTTL